MVKQKILLPLKSQKTKIKFPMVLTGEEAFWKDSAIIIKESQFVSFDEKGKKNLVGTFDEKRVVLTAYFQDLNIK